MTSGAWAEVDLSAIAGNVATLRSQSEVIAVVKADAYGHGLLPCAAAARAGGAGWLGVAFLSEALALRAGGDTERILAWLHPAGIDFAPGIAADIDLSVSSLAQVQALLHAVERAGRPARLHLKADTGLHRGGATPDEWQVLVAEVVKAQRDGRVELVSIWSHLSHGDEPDHPATDEQAAAFDRACVVAAAAGAGDVMRHLANSGAALTRPDLSFDAVRTGIAIYGLSPGPAIGSVERFGLRPAMTLRSALSTVKRVPTGSGVSYSHRFTTSTDTVLGLIPLGYADGLPRAATNRGPLLVGDRRVTVSGAVCMDQVVVDLGPNSTAHAGDPVVVFGPGSDGEPTVSDWATACDTIDYEIVTRLGPRIDRVYTTAETEPGAV